MTTQRATPPPPERAPALLLRDADGRPFPLVDPSGGPVVIAYAPGWDASAARAHEPALRAELRGFGATLLVLDRAHVWRFRADDPVDLLTAEHSGYALRPEDAAALLGLADAVDRRPWLAVLLVDPRGRVRFRHVERETGGRSSAVTLLSALRSAARTLRGEVARPLLQLTRRELVMTTLVSAFAFALLGGCTEPAPPPPGPPAPPPPTPAPAGTVPVTLRVNGQAHTLNLEPRVMLLDALRERLDLTGTKKGCDQGQCGACTVHVDGRRVLSCLTLAVMAQGAAITTIEGLAKGSELHPMQAAFLEHDGLQCGFCTPGQIMAAVALVHEGHATTDAEVRQQMSGNLCRCGAYPNIVAAIQSARGRS
jgi:xanthine dehydrogenase YagT iron-sulfur-binding subunit